MSRYVVVKHHACPICGPNLESQYNNSMKKMVYKGHTKYLPMDHPMRGTDVRPIPPKMKACNWLKLWIDARQTQVPRMKGLNAFFALPYWEHLLINHLLDPMHCFKNVEMSMW